MSLRLGTRGSALAIAQASQFAKALTAATGEAVELVEIVTDGDRSASPVQQLGVGVFVSALREALYAKEIDFAVHSYKDLPTAPAEALTLAAVPERDDCRDALITLDGRTLADLGPGSRIGTGAPRRVVKWKTRLPWRGRAARASCSTGSSGTHWSRLPLANRAGRTIRRPARSRYGA